jgi:hypothetical protein
VVPRDEKRPSAQGGELGPWLPGESRGKTRRMVQPRTLPPCPHRALGKAECMKPEASHTVGEPKDSGRPSEQIDVRYKILSYPEFTRRGCLGHSIYLEPFW